jgi:hypothetical protein
MLKISSSNVKTKASGRAVHPLGDASGESICVVVDMAIDEAVWLLSYV